MEQHDENLIILSTIVAVLISKVADFFLPLQYPITKIPSTDVWLSLILNMIFLIVATLGAVKVIGFLMRILGFKK